MTTCRDIITLAMRQARIVGMGRVPRASEAGEGMTALQSIYDSMFSDGPLGPFVDVYTTENYTAQENERIIAVGATVTIPDTIEEYDIIRAPKDLSAIVTTIDGAQTNRVYSINQWQVCNDLNLDSEPPLANRDEAGLAALLAMYYSEMYGTSLPPMTTRRAMEFRGRLSAKQSSDRGLADYF